MNTGTSLNKLRSFVGSAIKSGMKRTAHSVGFDVKRLRPSIEPHPASTLFSDILNVRHCYTESNEIIAFLRYCINNVQHSKAQLLQDLLVLFLLGEKFSGYFVEFGAMDGVTLSNTFLLESRHGWSGIVAEPARCWHRALKENRNCSIDFRCVWEKSGELLEFNETTAAEYSTISSFSDGDYHAESRMNGQRYVVETVSLADLLCHYNAPKVIDYLSIDTEGSELQILDSFSFDDYNIRVITVEHNHSDTRSRIHKLLTSKGYRRVFDELSKWDDWYMRTS